MLKNITPYLIVTFVAIPILGVIYAAPLILARRRWGRPGLWSAAVLCWLLMALAIVTQDPSTLHQRAPDLAFTTAILLGFAIGPAYLVDRASQHSPLLPVWKRIAYSIGGFYLGSAIVFFGAVLCLLLALLVKRIV